MKLIVEMEMPTRCYDCPFADGLYCIASNQRAIPKMVWIKRKPNWCPIKGELVTCGDCRRAIPFSVAGNRDALCHCDLFDATMMRKDFCSYGERKEKTDE